MLAKHANVKTTMDIYTKLNQEDLKCNKNVTNLKP